MIAAGDETRPLASAASSAELIIAVRDANDQFVNGFYTLPLPEDSSLQTLKFFFSMALPDRDFSLAFAIRNGDVVSQYRGFRQRPRKVGTGVLQVSLAWNPAQDLDLLLREPGGEDIFFGNRTAASGGRLDLDSNAQCQTVDGANNENIFYPAGVTPPSGMYRVFIGLAAQCVQGRGAVATVVIHRGPLRRAICVHFAASTKGNQFEIARFGFPTGALELPPNDPPNVEIRFCSDEQ
jgi:hypothetical protein